MTTPPKQGACERISSCKTTAQLNKLIDEFRQYRHASLSTINRFRRRVEQHAQTLTK